MDQLVQAFQGKRTGAGHLFWYFGDYKGVFATAIAHISIDLKKYFAFFQDALLSLVQL